MVHVKVLISAHTSLSCVLPAPMWDLRELQSFKKKPVLVWVPHRLQGTLLQCLEHIFPIPILLLWSWPLQSCFSLCFSLCLSGIFSLP